ncbi:hypothetical protein Dde_1338 [Oleidesulfovibrio alaskensis G20]|jgi:hypothetical protein|uniref:Uncharacterized protein n=1 Tax=Oleidesulfovibrio alaskensis (strain ATCC BAA-1058 / DSM 17464 / G20) TaxID=207559 RepID=Q312K7_OLEA2|nr:symporter small accessory protein [Oleidesulfovibrio alaskensis]ABB38139.1 hypothetical protein Dde_1338 [Oleidesulfovibrio alaskensis G20]MBG0774053.1 hypothetical protein [Oleidesulfovibrio alaskensis]MBL3583678.1 hypothetical protein [Oleidesulfovibrio alaskensis]
MMLGLGSLEAALAFWLSIMAACGCVGWGIWNWNEKGSSDAGHLPRMDTGKAGGTENDR